MANDKSFKIKNGLSVGTRYLQTGGADGSGTGPAYDIANASYSEISFDPSSQEPTPYALEFNNDGTKMYIVGVTNDTIYQYTLSTAYDVSTASYDSVSFSVASQEANPYSLTFSSDGTKMYIVGYTSDTVFQYSLSTAYDLSTASYSSVSFSVASQDTVPSDVIFNNNGTKMYMVGRSNDSIFQYTLSTAYDVSTSSYDSVSFSLASQDSQPSSIMFNNDGTKLYATGTASDAANQYSLSTAYDLSTTSYDNVSFSFTSQEANPLDMAFSADGSKLFMVGQTNDIIYQYSTQALTQTLDLSTGSYFSFTPSGATTVSFTNAPASGKAVGFAVEINGDGSAITWPTSVKWPSGVAPTATASKEVYAFVTTDGGTSYYGKLAGSDIA